MALGHLVEAEHRTLKRDIGPYKARSTSMETHSWLHQRRSTHHLPTTQRKRETYSKETAIENLLRSLLSKGPNRDSETIQPQRAEESMPPRHPGSNKTTNGKRRARKTSEDKLWPPKTFVGVNPSRA
eukprot:Gb_35588 [translate_table: standard]